MVCAQSGVVMSLFCILHPLIWREEDYHGSLTTIMLHVASIILHIMSLLSSSPIIIWTYIHTRQHCRHLNRRRGLWTLSLTFSEVSWSPLSRVISSGTQSYTFKDALKVSPQKINTDICFVVFCWLQNIWFGLFQAAQHRLIQLHHSTTAASLFTALN